MFSLFTRIQMVLVSRHGFQIFDKKKNLEMIDYAGFVDFLHDFE